MPRDVGYWIVFGGFLLAVVAFVVGLAWHQLTGRRSQVPDEAVAEGAPPPWSGAFTPGWWRISSRIYEWYDLLVIGGILVIYLSPLLTAWVTPDQEVPKLTVATAVATIGIQGFMMALVVGVVAWRLAPSRWLGMRWPMWPLGFPIAVGGVLFTWGVLAIMQMTGFFEWLQDQLGHDGKQEVVKAFTETDDPVLLGLLVFIAVIVAPVTEEVMFRGYFYPASKKFIGRWAAILFSSLIFAVIHHNAQAMVPLFILAVLLTLSYEFTGSIWAPIGMHMLFNGVTVGVQLAIKYGWIEAPVT